MEDTYRKINDIKNYTGGTNEIDGIFIDYVCAVDLLMINSPRLLENFAFLTHSNKTKFGPDQIESICRRQIICNKNDSFCL